MKILVTILFLSLLSSPSWGLSIHDLVYRQGVYYEKFSDVPFSGKSTGLWNSSIKNGKMEGEWVIFWPNGQLQTRSNYKNGEWEGVYVSYWGDGKLWGKGNYKNGAEEGEWISYYDNGQLSSKGSYKNGKREGEWISLRKTGELYKPHSGTFKKGVKISD